MSIRTDKSINLLSQILPSVEEEIETALANKPSLATTHLAQSLHEKFNIPYSHMYHLITFYVYTQDDLKVRPGKSGGIVRV